ncbi:family 16 glycoside hydrolase [Pontibacter sp. MBLB2868]|uniref:family 16 glycoside hydrolase n=1 Tax=Pontibacter sp. MBLB2868 TaxID=3451555 RepID=UPI003F752927
MKKLFLFLWSMAFGAAALASEGKFSFRSGNWVEDGEKTKVERYLGQESLYLQRGHLLYREAEMQDGILEVDIAPDPTRGLAGIIFRHDGKNNYEEIYIRQGKSGQPDALQYTPVFNGSSSWQLYAEHQSRQVFRPGEWIHLKVEVRGALAKVYLDYSEVPAMVIPNLGLGSKGGKFGLWTLNGAYFSNFNYTPLDSSTAPSQTIRLDVPPNTILKWQVSQAFPAKDMQTEVWPKLQQLNWDTLPTDAQGLLNIAQYRSKQEAEAFENNSDDMVWVKLELNSEKEQTKKLYFEYSNKAHVLINGQPIYFGNNSFRAKNMIFRGEIDKTLRTNAIYLPLKKGKNTVLIALASKANGWGIMGRFEDMQGISLR